HEDQQRDDDQRAAVGPAAGLREEGRPDGREHGSSRRQGRPTLSVFPVTACTRTTSPTARLSAEVARHSSLESRTRPSPPAGTVSMTVADCPTSASVLEGTVVGVMCFTTQGRSQMKPISEVAAKTTSCTLLPAPSAATIAVITLAGAKAPMKKP